MNYCFICGKNTDQSGSFHFFATQEDVLHFCDKHANQGRKLFGMIDKKQIDKDKLQKVIDKRKVKHSEESKMSENYIMLNGKRVDLTEKQLEKLGLKVEKKEDCFKKANKYYFISNTGDILRENDVKHWADVDRYKIANYCTDKELMQQRALHETLSRLLWRFSMQNDGDKINWDNGSCKYFIAYSYCKKEFRVNYYPTPYGCILKSDMQYFHSVDIAKRAINEIVIPFMKKHPEFVW